ncbi:peroxidase-like protein 3 [Ruditapes philippinarum]|uniref:peroxidase-like protein 3 n=1 Tax=Ruditapes philippinarum TaxID=129788 RepID=UPI00295B13C6|nr:peroxidase-like protein 3 [Ruditapes philippinarum]
MDLFTGVLTELPVTAGTGGPTLECILGEQFMRLKFGDRFWYQGSDVGLNGDQQSAIRNHTLSRIMCDNFDFNEVQYPSAFMAGDPASCRGIPQLNIDVFKPATTATTTTTTTTTAPPATNRPTQRPPNNRPPPGGGRRPGRTFDDALAQLLRELEEMNEQD